MKSSMMACAVVAALAGCSSTGGDNMFASRDTTVEYYRVFDIKTTAPADTVAKAASTGINRNVKDAVVATPGGVQVADLPGHFKIADPSSAAPGTAVEKGPSCDGASWTAKAAPQVRGSDNMNLVACLFPYKSGYHLDMYAVFTKPEGGWLALPRRVGGMVMGTPEKFTEATMMDLVRAIREGTSANVSLVEAKPTLAGTPWLEATVGSGTRASTLAAPATPAAPAATAAVPASASAPESTSASAPASTPAATPASSPVVTSPVAAPGAPEAPAATAPASQGGASAPAESASTPSAAR